MVKKTEATDHSGGASRMDWAGNPAWPHERAVWLARWNSSAKGGSVRSLPETNWQQPSGLQFARWLSRH